MRQRSSLVDTVKVGGNIRDVASALGKHTDETYGDGHKPGLIPTIYVAHPRGCFGFCCCFYFAFTILLTIILSIAGSNPINLDNLTNFAFADPTNKFWLRMQAYTLMTANADYDWGESDDSPTCRQSDIEGYIYIIPEALNGNILTQKNLKILENWEQTITSAPGYENYCYLTTEDCSDDDNKDGYLYTTNGGDCCVSRYTNLDAVSGKGSYNITDENGCYHIVSPLYYFRKYGDASFSDISGTVATIEEKSSSDYTALQKMLDDDFSVNNPKSKIAKMTGYFADPLNRTITRKHVAQGDDDYIGDDYIEYNILSEWMGESYTTWTATLNDKSPVRGFYYFEPGGVDVGDYVTSDLSLAIVGLVLVYVYMMIQIRSVFVASCAMFQILCSFFGGNLVYRYIFPNDDGFGYKNYFTLFEALAIFIIIGIGADDCFVFLDIWKEYETKSVDTVQRLSATWAHAGKAMLVTSLTTFSAFLTNLNSDFSFIQAFGAYCALIVLLNYIMVMTFFPAVVLYYHKHLEKFCGYCCPCCMPKGEDKEAETSDEGQTPVTEANASTNEESKGWRCDLGNWLSNTYAPALFRVRYAVLAVYFMFVIAFFVMACMVTAKTFTNADYLAPDTNWYKFWTFFYTGFGGTFDPISAKLVFGLDYSDPVVYANSYKYYTWLGSDTDGSANYNTSWELSNPQGQIQLKETCSWLRNERWVTDNMHIDRSYGVNYADDDDILDDDDDDDSVYPNYYGITCPMEALASFENVTSWDRSTGQWSADKPYKNKWGNTVNVTTPDCNYCFSYFSTYPQPTGAAGDYTLETPLEYMTNTSSIIDGCDCMGVFPIPEKVCLGDRKYLSGDTRFKCQSSTDNFHGDLTKFINDWGWSDYVYATANADGSLNRIVSTVVSVSLSRSSLTTSYDKGLEIVDAWENWADKYNHWVEKNTESQMKCFVYISDTTDWLVTKLLYKNALDNTIQSMILCFIIILLATENWILALLTSFNIASIVIVIFGIIYAAGWGLNLFESILVVIIVGFSCDFSIHMADSYIEHEEAGRFEKVKASLGVTGISIISGSLSTLLATAPMLGAKIVFFSRFGQIMFLTMSLSTVFTLGPFSCILMMFGPQGHAGMMSNFYGPLLRSAFENLEVKESVLRRQSMATHTKPGHEGKAIPMPSHENPIHEAGTEEDGGPSEDRL